MDKPMYLDGMAYLGEAFALAKDQECLNDISVPRFLKKAYQLAEKAGKPLPYRPAEVILTKFIENYSDKVFGNSVDDNKPNIKKTLALLMGKDYKNDGFDYERIETRLGIFLDNYGKRVISWYHSETGNRKRVVNIGTSQAHLHGGTRLLDSDNDLEAAVGTSERHVGLSSTQLERATDALAMLEGVGPDPDYDLGSVVFGDGYGPFGSDDDIF